MRALQKHRRPPRANLLALPHWAYGHLPYSTFEAKKPGGFRDKTDINKSRYLFLPLLLDAKTGKVTMEYRETWSPLKPAQSS